MKDPKVAIVIPAYNEQDNIAICLDFIAKQTTRPDEVIVVDNNSTDKTVEIAKKYDFVKVVHEKKQGIAHARNRGFSEARSDVIGRIDADSRLSPGWVESVKKYYRSPKHARSGVSGRCYYYNAPWPKLAGKLQYELAFVFNKLIIGGYILWGSNMAIPREVWREVKSELCDRNDIHEDIDIAIHMLKKDYQIDYRRSLLVGVRARRVLEDRSKLWPNLMLWPKTLRLHGYKLWWLANIASGILYLSSLPFYFLHQIRKTHK